MQNLITRQRFVGRMIPNTQQTRRTIIHVNNRQRLRIFCCLFPSLVWIRVTTFELQRCRERCVKVAFVRRPYRFNILTLDSKRRYSIPFFSLFRCAYLLLVSLASKNRVLYSEGRVYKKEPELAASTQSTTLHSTGKTSVKKGASKTKSATATHVDSKPLLFFPLNYCCTYWWTK